MPEGPSAREYIFIHCPKAPPKKDTCNYTHTTKHNTYNRVRTSNDKSWYGNTRHNAIRYNTIRHAIPLRYAPCGRRIASHGRQALRVRLAATPTVAIMYA